VSSQPDAAPPDLIIRAAVRDDVDLVLSFIRQLAEYERLGSEVEATREALETTLFGPHPAAEVVIASVGGRDVGFALFFGTYSTFLARPCMHLEDLFVVPEARGRGIGHALLARVAAIAEARGCGRLQWNVLTWNAPAIAFYQRLGAISLDDWQTFRLNRQGLQALAASGIAKTPRS
jgi:GNAT superfamily N-acetyltransferase